MDYITLNNGVKMPQLGLGTFMLEPDDAEAAVKSALENGYELIDTANAYVNERAVGRGMKASGRAREEIFLETKLWPSFYESDTAVDETLERLGTDYIDLMILHQPAGNFIEGYRKLEAAYAAGKLRAIGISNFPVDKLSQLLDACEVTPALIQVECHPLYPQTELKKTLAQHDIALQAWYPLGGRGNGSILSDPTVATIAEAHAKTPAQVILRWHMQQGNAVVPGSKTPEHIVQNTQIFDFELTDAEMDEMGALAHEAPLFTFSEEKLASFAAFRPDVEGQK